MNRWVVLVPTIVVVVLVGLWAAENLPFIPNTQSFRLTAHPYPIPYTNNSTYQWVDLLAMPHGGTASGTYWVPNGTLIQFLAAASDFYQSTNSSGSFHVGGGNSPDALTFSIILYSRTTVYINGTISCLMPLI